MFTLGQQVICTNILPLAGNSVAPSLRDGVEYVVEDICLDKKGNKHLDVGPKSQYNYITSFETKEELPNGDKIHWCHPSRFKITDIL